MTHRSRPEIAIQGWSRRHVTTVAAIVVAVVLVRLGGTRIEAQPAPVALSGLVSSQAEGNMEGVLVTVRRTGAPLTVTVVTGQDGRYAFPRATLQPGPYAISVRAIGYDLEGRKTVYVAADNPARADLRLTTTTDLASQLTSLEWILSMPGTPEEKRLLVRRPANCVFCHEMDRVVRSRHTAEQWIPVIERMGTYHPDYTGLLRHQKLPRPATAPAASPEQAPQVSQVTKDLAAYLAKVNLSTSTTWDYPLKTLPRPKGRATRVVITQYDLPRQDSSVHDIDVDSKGNVWYGDSGYDYIGRLDPKTGTFQEWKAPNALPAPPAIEGVLDVQVDKDDGLWAVVWGASLARFDTHAERWRSYDLPPRTRLNFIAPFHGRDGPVWATEVRASYRVDPRSGKVDTFATPYERVPGPHRIYMIERDSKDNAYFMDFGGSSIGRIDAKSGEATIFATPTKSAFPRRGRMDGQDRLWFAEFYADKIGVFDTKTERFQEFPIDQPYISPYFARPVRNGDLWTSSHGSDRLLRLDPNTGEIVQYLMPSYYDARKVVVDETAGQVTVWLPNKNTGQLIRVEPLD